MSGSQPSASPSSRPTCATSRLWVSRLRTKSSVPGAHDLRLRAQPPQRERVDDAGPVAGEVAAARILGRLGVAPGVVVLP